MGFFSNLFGAGPGGGAFAARGAAKAVPERIDDEAFEASIRRAVAGMREELHEALRSSAETMSALNRLRAEHERLVRIGEDRREEARAALVRGDEQAARRALADKAGIDAQAASLRPDLKRAQGATEELSQRVAVLRGRIEEAERNAETLISRRNAARAQRKVARALASSGDDDAFDAIRMMEGGHAAAGEHRRAGDAGGPHDAEIDAELARLRSELDQQRS